MSNQVDLLDVDEFLDCDNDNDNDNEDDILNDAMTSLAPPKTDIVFEEVLLACLKKAKVALPNNKTTALSELNSAAIKTMFGNRMRFDLAIFCASDPEFDPDTVHVHTGAFVQESIDVYTANTKKGIK
ncbi:hypothetical protein ScalyP_jg2738 [Parmales sp. scaly parma]|jgi:hypothetical protein|nr:hypothetical protein ScalyP_jg2738 [Parmales sp. scaly parma]